MAKEETTTPPKPVSEIEVLGKIGKEFDRLEQSKGDEALIRTLNWVLSRYAPDGFSWNFKNCAELASNNP